MVLFFSFYSLFLEAQTKKKSDSSSVKWVGSYSNYSREKVPDKRIHIDVWQDQGEWIGHFNFGIQNKKNIQTSTGKLEEMKYDKKTGEISFHSQLTPQDVKHRPLNGEAASKDWVKFYGTFLKDEFKGTIEYHTMKDSKKTQEDMEVTLTRYTLEKLKENKKSNLYQKDFENLKDWEKYSKGVYKDWGPEW
jgi:ribosomal protein L33